MILQVLSTHWKKIYNIPTSNWGMTSPNEDELQVRKMEKLSETYFDNELDSEIYFPVSTLKTSQFYPGGKELHHQTPALWVQM